jgi:IS30 family transposase
MEKTETQYKQLGAEERATIMLMQQASKGLREIGRFLNRSPSTISREINRDLGHESGYVASLAGEQAQRLRIKPRKALKLALGAPLLEIVKTYLKNCGRPNKSQATSSACTQTRRNNALAMKRFTIRCTPCRVANCAVS